ncbi:MAG: shikimate dehydrogenase [Flavobacteriaceae bacterium TMED68]|nr:MAG: shikimate dehydrogenase [Flavobacteriaceae bacterium TMED68]|tara:strand:+ start:28639 stop:29394 length:756 start_codon:yes stop_codon:yes gene_type:complete
MRKEKQLKLFGLIGRNIDYSFSKKYFSKKFKKNNLNDCIYSNYDLKEVGDFKKLINTYSNLKGLNVTIPYKKIIIPFLDELSEEAKAIKAVNTIVFESSGKIIGHNTDHLGFKKALEEQFKLTPENALILGSGGASEAIKYVFNKIGCNFKVVSRFPSGDQLNYDQLSKKIIRKTDIIVNASPIGTYPNILEAPNIPYKYLDTKNSLFDLIYNPKETEFLKKGKFYGSKTSNGFKMLKYQAEESWKLWTFS